MNVEAVENVLDVLGHTQNRDTRHETADMPARAADKASDLYLARNKFRRSLKVGFCNLRNPDHQNSCLWFNLDRVKERRRQPSLLVPIMAHPMEHAGTHEQRDPSKSLQKRQAASQGRRGGHRRMSSRLRQR